MIGFSGGMRSKHPDAPVTGERGSSTNVEIKPQTKIAAKIKLEPSNPGITAPATPTKITILNLAHWTPATPVLRLAVR